MSAREIIAVPIALVSMLFLMLAVAMPFLLIEQAKQDARSLGELEKVQVYINQNFSRYGSLPADDQLRRWAAARNLDLAFSVSTTPLGCLNKFEKAPQDRYIVGFWAGEWSECVSYPSGATTLRPSLWALLISGLWVDVLTYILLGIGLGWTAWVIGLHQRPGIR